MPKTGTRPTRSATAAVGPGRAAGSPGPLERNTPSGSSASTSSAAVPAGTTVTVPSVVSSCTMVVLTPKSYATIRRPPAAPSPVPGCSLVVAGRDARHQVQAVGAVGGGRGGAQLGFGSRAEGARDRTGPADVARQSPGVDAGQRRNAVPAQEGLEGLGGAPVRRLAGQVAHHDPPAVRDAGLVVGGVRAVVPDVGAGEGDHLARVGRVRDHLLVAAHGGVEHELARGHGQRGAGRLAAEDAAVRRHQQRRRPVALAGRADRLRAHRCAAASITTASPRSTVCRTAPAKVRPA